MISVLYLMLVVCVVLLAGVGVAMYLRVRRLSRASDTQFRRAVEAEETGQPEPAQAAHENG